MMLTNELIPYVNNPRKNDKAVEKVAASIQEFGFKVPIIITSNFEIIAGHTRLKAAKKLELESVPVIIADDLTPEQIKAFRIADNRVSEEAEWDLDLLKAEFEALSTEGMDLDILGFSEKELYSIMNAEIQPLELETQTNDVTQAFGNYLVFGDYRMRLTEVELENLNFAAAKYVKETGSEYGFASSLLEGRK